MSARPGVYFPPVPLKVAFTPNGPPPWRAPGVSWMHGLVFQAARFAFAKVNHEQTECKQTSRARNAVRCVVLGSDRQDA